MKLAIAFGSRGSGKALAHYEPGRTVINLTKMKGAGSLAHEWGHALDDALGEACGFRPPNTYLSSLVFSKKMEVYESEIKHKDIIDAMKKVVLAMRQADVPFEEIDKQRREAVLKYAEKLKIAAEVYIEDIVNLYKLMIGAKREELLGECNKLFKEVVIYVNENHKKIVSSIDKIKAGSREDKIYDIITEGYRNITAGVSVRLDDIILLLEDKMRESNSIKYDSIDVGDVEREKAEMSLELYREVRNRIRKFRRDLLEDRCGTAAIRLLDRLWESYIDLPKYGPSENESKKCSNYYENAKKLDEGRKRIYYSYVVEMFARAFESYIYDQLDAQGLKNQYLVHSVCNEEYNDLKPYPEGEERERINAAIEELLLVVRKNLAPRYMRETLSIDRFYDKSRYKSYRDSILIIDKETGEILNKKEESTPSNTTIKPEVERGIKVETPTKEKVMEGLTLKQKLIQIAGKNENNNTLDQILDEVALRGKVKLGYMQIALLNIQGKKLQPQGNSKAYVDIQLPQGRVMGIEQNAKVEKRVEGVLEGLVTRIIKDKYGVNANRPEIGLIIEGVTFMFCKRVGLDVRTYLNTDGFKVLSNNERQSLTFIRLCKENFEYVYMGLGLMGII